jgi:ABC-type Fe3+ transport system substrate-binding protein
MPIWSNGTYLPSGLTPKATYSATILQNTPNPDGGQKFLSFLLGPNGSELMKKHGLSLLHPQLVSEGRLGQLRGILRQSLR